MRIFMTGASGFVGSHVFEKLIAAGHDVLYLSRDKLPGWRIQKSAKSPHAFPVHGSLFNVSSYVDAFKVFRPEAVFHLAWEGVAGEHRDDAAQEKNLHATMALLTLSKQESVKDFIGLGSQAEYGICHDIIRENQPSNPVSLYGKVKLATCFAAQEFCKGAAMRFAWLRLFSSYGPKDNKAFLIPYVCLSLIKGQKPSLTQCNQMWDYIHVEDVASALVAVLNSPQADGIYNLGSGYTTSLKWVVETLRDGLNLSLPLGFGEKPYAIGQVMRLEADIGRLKQATAWAPVMPISEGLLQTALWYKENYHHYS